MNRGESPNRASAQFFSGTRQPPRALHEFIPAHSCLPASALGDFPGRWSVSHRRRRGWWTWCCASLDLAKGCASDRRGVRPRCPLDSGGSLAAARSWAWPFGKGGLLCGLGRAVGFAICDGRPGVVPPESRGRTKLDSRFQIPLIQTSRWLDHSGLMNDPG
jgi:hypothetical protein